MKPLRLPSQDTIGNAASLSRLAIGPSNWFLWLAPLLYFAYAVLTPPFQTFDENQHLYRAWQLSSFQWTAERRGTQSGGELPKGLADATFHEIQSLVPQGPRSNIIRPITDIFSHNTPVEAGRQSVYLDFFGSASYSPTGYLPQVITIWIGKATGLSVEWIVRLGRLLNALLCVGLIWWAITVIPFGRWVMVTIALLPPTAAAAASFGQDGLMIGCGFLLTALGLKAAEDKQWSHRAFVHATVALIAVATAKIVYLPLIAVAAMPVPRGQPLLRWFAVPLIAASVSMILLFGWLQANADSMVVFRAGLPSVHEQVAWAVSHPVDFIGRISETYAVRWDAYLVGLYTFGDSTIRNVEMAAIPGIAALLVAMVRGENREIALPVLRRVWMIFLFLAVALLIATALSVSMTRPDERYIAGIQGRYFLPVLPLASIALMYPSNSTPSGLIPAALALLLISHALTLQTILSSFYLY